jgi:hypothetical protein
MTAVTLTELSTEDAPINVVNGTGKRRVKVYVRATTALTGETLNLATYVPGAADIEGIFFETDDGVAEHTSSTWSTLVVTVGPAGVWEAGFIVTLT